MDRKEAYRTLSSLSITLHCYVIRGAPSLGEGLVSVGRRLLYIHNYAILDIVKHETLQKEKVKGLENAAIPNPL